MKLGPSPFEWLVFDKDGNLKDPAAVGRINTILADSSIGDLVILSHGWNNDQPAAEQLYRALWGNTAAALTARGSDPASFAVIGVLWPAKAFDAVYDGAADIVPDTVAGGALAVDANRDQSGREAPPEVLENMLAQVAAFADDQRFDQVATAARAASVAPLGETAAFTFFKEAMTALGIAPGGTDPELAEDARFFSKAGSIDGATQLFAAFASPARINVAPDVGSAQGIGDIVRGAFQGPRSGAVRALNMLTYYTMKKRAGTVGGMMGALLGSLTLNHRIRLHLVGHSFGGRLVTATAARYAPTANFPFRSLTLLQAAYSHNGMTANKGPFSSVVGKPSGPISFTHTHNDKACTIAYPLASRLSGDTTQGLGDANDPYGAMGANGPQLSAALMAPDSSTTQFAPVPGKINRFLADAYVLKTATGDAHNNVANADCGRLVAATITA